MATARDIRRLAFQALFQLDAHAPVRGGSLPDGEVQAVRASLDEADGFTGRERDKAFALAQAAFADRAAADAVFTELAPTWPAHRQAAVDRAILRLAHYEMTSGAAAPKIAVNEAVELAKTYSTEKSPAFINALLDKVLKRLAATAASTPAASPSPPHASD